jgi:ABC-2 type transport system permease protein
MDKMILKAVLFCARLLVRQGVDFERLKIIAETKLLMDRRRVYMNWRQRQQKENSNPLLITLAIYAFFGLFAGAMVFAVPSLALAMVLIHSYLLFMMAMTMITDFSSVLLDTTDNQIILPRPVNSKTLFIARLVHILVYLLQFIIALALFPVIFIFARYGFAVGIVSIATVLLTGVFAVFITYLLYAVILRFSNEQKVKDIVGYFQIFMTIFFAVGFQIVPRLINFDNLSGDFHLHWYSYLLPPVWMAVTLESIQQLNFDIIHSAMIACAFILPVVTFWLMIKYLAPSFANKLAALNVDAGSKKLMTTAKPTRTSFSEKLSGLFCRSKTEIAGFEMVWKITGRDKGFKLQFYPSLAYMLVFIFIFVFKSGKDVNTLWENLPSTQMFLFFIYLPMLSIGNGIMFVSFHENFLASWIYQSTPVAKPGQIISGSLKALLTKFFLPVFFILFLFSFYVWGVAIIDDFVAGFFNNVLIFLVIANLGDHYLPFSRQQNVKQQSGRFIKVLLQMLIIAALVGLHYLVLKNDWLIYCLIPVSAVGCYFLFKRIQNLPWFEISF